MPGRMPSQPPELDQLTALAINVKSVEYDWSRHAIETEWNIVEPVAPTPILKECVECSGHGTHEGRGDINCPDCWGLGRRVDFDTSHSFFNDHMQTDREQDIIIDSEEGGGDGSMIRDCWIENSYESESWVPAMNYYYLVPELDRHWQPNEAALVLDEHVPMTLVHIAESDEYAMALTGGGMDLTWEICWAYILLGYLPPTDHTSLPRMGGMKWNDRSRLIVKACRRILELDSDNIGYAQGRLKDLEKELKEGR